MMTLEQVNAILATRDMEAGSIEQGTDCYDVQGALLTVTMQDRTAEIHICIPPTLMRRYYEISCACLDECRKLGAHTVITAIEKDQHKAAHKLVRRLGFTPSGCYNNHIVYARGL
jgi:hypothetical protein